MENSLKGLILAAGIVITCLVVGVGFYVSREAKTLAGEASGEISNMLEDTDDMRLQIYHNTVVSGKEVVAAIRKYTQEGYTIAVKTSAGTLVSYTESHPYSIEQERKNVNYINPSGNFTGSLVRDTSNVIRGVEFYQDDKSGKTKVWLPLDVKIANLQEFSNVSCQGNKALLQNTILDPSVGNSQAHVSFSFPNLDPNKDLIVKGHLTLTPEVEVPKTGAVFYATVYSNTNYNYTPILREFDGDISMIIEKENLISDTTVEFEIMVEDYYYDNARYNLYESVVSGHLSFYQ
ncbi:MAG: hypothetical protein ACI4CT_03555 [Lachnospiraceae bacterium]